MNYNASNSRGVSRVVMASAIAITLGMTAVAQDSPQASHPTQDRSKERSTYATRTSHLAPQQRIPTLRKGPDRDREARARGVTYSQPRLLLARLWIFRTSDRPRRRSIEAWWARSNC